MKNMGSVKAAGLCQIPLVFGYDLCGVADSLDMGIHVGMARDYT